MLRPATPLSVLLLIAFGLLMIAVLSTPIIKGIPLASVNGVNMGAFGFCNPSGCSPVEVGFDTTKVFDNETPEASFDVPSSVRNTLSTLLIIHPIAAFIVLAYFIMALAAHFHSPAHSFCYLLSLFLIGLLGFLVCLLAFLVDVLLFIPHLAWGSYVVLAAAIVVFICTIASCVMRRSMASRKARRNKVDENAEMSGENYHKTRTQPNPQVPTASEVTMVQEPTVPVLNRADSPPQFATYDSQKKEEGTSEERIPLTAPSPSDRSLNPLPLSDMNNNTYDAPGPGPYDPPSRSNTRGPPPPLTQPRDQYDGPMGPPDGYRVRRGTSNERMTSRGGGMPQSGYRVRGAYGPPPPGRGGYGPGGGYGPPPPGRGGYASRGRGGGGGGYGAPRGRQYAPRGRGYGPRGAYGSNSIRGGRTPLPPPGPYHPGPPYDGPYDREASPAAGYYGDPHFDQRMYPGVVSPQPSYPPPAPAPTPAQAYQAYAPGSNSDQTQNNNGYFVPRPELPSPLPSEGDESRTVQAVELDATPGSEALSHGSGGNAPGGVLRDSDADVAGMVALQQGAGSHQPALGLASVTGVQQHESVMSHSQYSTDENNEYVPARQSWSQNVAPGTALGSPTDRQVMRQASANSAVSRRQTEPETAPVPAESDYYEDVDPRFAEANQNTELVAMTHGSMTPSHLSIPGVSAASYEEIPSGARSPAESERSTFTSISQRGVNPRWNGGTSHPSIGGGGSHVFRRPVPQRGPPNLGADILSTNPDFELSTTGRRRGGAGTIPNSAYPSGL